MSLHVICISHSQYLGDHVGSCTESHVVIAWEQQCRLHKGAIHRILYNHLVLTSISLVHQRAYMFLRPTSLTEFYQFGAH